MRGAIQYPAPFGRDATPEEAKIAELDAKTGASLKVICHEIITCHETVQGEYVCICLSMSVYWIVAYPRVCSFFQKTRPKSSNVPIVKID